VLFVDLVGFTTLSEQRDAEDVRELLTRYFDAARTVVERYAGTVEKFIGDAVMAVWGSPVAQEDDAERAVRAALDVVDAVAALAETTGIPTLRARAGVVTGQAASWGAGGEALVVGDRVNTAARIQGLAEPGTVLVDDQTRQRSLASIAYEEAGVHQVKGKDEPLQVWRAQRVVAGALGTDRVDGLEARFLGRDSELRLVKDLFHGSAERHQARMALVVGAPGTGKSRLRSEFSRYVDGLAAMTFWHVGRCLSYGEGVAFWALAEAVRHRLGIAEDAPDPEAERLLDAGLAQYVPNAQEAAYLRPRLAALLGLPGGDGFDRQDLMAGWRTFFQRLADEYPVILVFEDLQWADTALLDFLDHLLEWAASSPIFVLGLARPELLERRTSWVAGRRNQTVLWLDRLPDQAIGELLDDLVPGMPAGVRGRIVEQAEGIPLYAVESIRALVDRGQVVARDGRYVLEGPITDLDVPPSLTSLLASRLDALAPDERTVAMRMSVFRGGFSREAVRAVAEIAEDRIDEVLSSLVRREVLAVESSRLSPDQGQYGYAQAMLRQVAYDMLGKRERKARHVAAAEHLALTFTDSADVGEVLASHYRGAYEAVPDDADAPHIRRLAHHAYMAAGERGLTVGSPDVAERSFAMAASMTEGSERIAALLRAGDAALTAGRSDRMLHFAEQVLEGPDTATPLQWGEATMLAGRGHAVQGRIRESLALRQAIIDRLPTPSEDEIPLLVRAWASRASGQLALNLFDDAAASLDRALRLAEELGDRNLVADVLATQGSLMQITDRPIQAMVAFEGALRLATSPMSIENMRVNLGDSAMQADEPEALDHFEFALERARQRGDRTSEAMAVLNLAQVRFLRGDWSSGRAGADEMVRTLVEFGYPPELQIGVRLIVGVFARFRGDVAELTDGLAVLRQGAESEDPWDVGVQRWLELECAAMQGEDVVESLAVEADASLSQGMRTEWFRYAWVDALGEARRAGRHDVVDRLIALASDRPIGIVPPFLRAQLRRYQGLRLADDGDVQGGDDLLRQAVETLDGLGYPYWTACAQLDRASILDARGQAEQASQLREQALTVLRDLGAGHVLAAGAEVLHRRTSMT
jgi:class 3 adenylate cyclase/tetratricopeptide (TPR) repeat protein